jgi:transposase InsO family protein
VAENVLARAFWAQAPCEAWVGDITFIPTAQGWLYLAVLLDLFSRRVVGWAMSETIDRSLCLSALRMALRNCKPKAGLLHHTDRGSQYASLDYQAALRAAGAVSSMSRKGNCWDNAVAESFFATLKQEPHLQQAHRVCVLVHVRAVNATVSFGNEGRGRDGP